MEKTETQEEKDIDRLEEIAKELRTLSDKTWNAIQGVTEVDGLLSGAEKFLKIGADATMAARSNLEKVWELVKESE